jgi:hypothetical protein
MNLLCQLARRRKNQGADAPRLAANEAIENGEHERRRFSRSCLRQAENVPPREDDRDGLLLDGGRGLILNAGNNVRVKREMLETH